MQKPIDFQSGFAELGGTSFYYEVKGHGPPLVLLHAGIADLRMWESQFNLFAAHFRVVRYDLRGYGRTKAAAGNFSHHNDLLELMDYLALERAHLLGCSIGGGAIVDFTLEHPERVLSLIPVASVPSGYELKIDRAQGWEEAVGAFENKDFVRAAEYDVQIWVDGPRRKSDEVDPSVRDLVLQMNAIALENESLQLGEEQALEPGAVTRLEEIKSPTLIITGDLDNPELLAGVEILAAGVSGAQKRVIPGTAHLPNMEEPEEFNRIVLEFLQAQEKSE